MTETQPRAGARQKPELEFTADDRMHGALVLSVLQTLIDPLAQALVPRTEVVLHDLTKLPGSIHAISGTVTGRGVGGPATDLGLRTFSTGWREHLIGYRTETSGGLPMRSSSIFFQAPSGRAVVCLCLNTDVSDVIPAQELLRSLSAIASISPSLQSFEHPTEKFPTSVDDLAQGILADAVAEIGIPIEAMKKRQKVEVVRRLRDRGFFTMREGVPSAAQHLGVGRHTIYNYINELDAEGDGVSDT